MSNDEKRPLGRILLQRKLVPRELQSALQPLELPAPPSSSARPVVETATDPEHDALVALADGSGTPGLDLRRVVVTLAHLDVVPREVAEALCILPVLLVDDRLYVAMADPTNKRTVDELEFVSGRSVQAFIAVRSTLFETIAAAYDAKARGEPRYAGSRAPPESG